MIKTVKASAIICSTMLCLFIMSCGKGRVYESDKWKVTLLSSEYGDYKYQSLEPPSYSSVEKRIEGLVIRTEISYIGPGAAAPAPEVRLKREGEEKKIDFIFSHMVCNYDDNTTTTKIGKSGTAKADYVFDVPDDDTEYILIIGDLNPIKVKP